MLFTWSFWPLHDIPGLGKYGFSCSGRCVLVRNIYNRKLLVGIKCHNLHCYKEEMILLCHSVLKQDEYHISLALLSLKFF